MRGDADIGTGGGDVDPSWACLQPDSAIRVAERY